MLEESWAPFPNRLLTEAAALLLKDRNYKFGTLSPHYPSYQLKNSQTQILWLVNESVKADYFGLLVYL